MASLIIARTILRNNYYVAAHDGTVSIMRGIQGSLLGYPLQTQFRTGCLTDQDTLRILDAGASQNGCTPLKVEYLRPAERVQVTAGLPVGSLDDATKQLYNLVSGALLPVCGPAPPTQTSEPGDTLPPATQEPGKDCRPSA